MISSRIVACCSSLFTFVLLAAPVPAAEFYVSPSGDNASSGTSASSPWRTLAKANSALKAGDTVYLRGGKYLDDPIRPARSGTATAPIRYAAYRGEIPVLTSNKVGGLKVAVELSERSHIVVDGIHVDGVKPNPKARVDHFVSIFDGNHNTIQNCTFRYATGWHGVRITDGAHHNKLLNNTLDVVGVYDDGSGQDWGDVIQIKSDSHHNVVEGNTVTRGAHNLLQVDGEYNVIRGNVFDNDWSEILGKGKGGRNLSLMGKHNVFEGNIVRNASASTDKPRNAGMKVEGRHNIVRRNFIYANSNEGITTQSRSGQKWARHNRIYNNTLYANDGPAWALVYYNGGNSVMDNVFKNNIVFENRRASSLGDSDIVFKLGSNAAGVVGESSIEGNLMATRSSNDSAVDVADGGGRIGLTQAEKKFSAHFQRNILAAPTFVSSRPESPEDFALADGSRGIDEGLPLTRTRGSGSGKVIPVADAGYFTDGFSLVPGDRIQIGGGQPLAVVDVDYDKRVVTVNEAVQWDNGAPVSLEYRGAGPDIGAYETGFDTAVPIPRRPRPPRSMRGTVR